MQKVITLIAISLFLIGFIGAIGITSKAIDNSTFEENQVENNLRERSRERLTESQIREIITEKNRIKAELSNGECPDTCICSGSTIKCELEDGTREITVNAGKSGNVIIQVKGINASVMVTLYKSKNGTLYAVTKNNETRTVRMLPDQIKEKLREKTSKILEDEEITLDEDGTYQYEGRKKSKLFLFIPIKIKVRAEIDAETGEIIKTSKPNWWEFLTKDEQDQIVGASCGTVTPGENDACCQTKGYNIWNSEKGECVFSE